MRPLRCLNKILAIVSLLLATPPSWGADSAVEEKIVAIRKEYAAIEKELKDDRQVKPDLPDESAEGGELTAYFKGATLRKLSARFFGETGKALEEYYFVGNELIFVLRADTRYTKPNSGVVKNKTEQRFYFAGGKLIRWLNPDNKDVTSDPSKPERERELLSAAKKYSAMATQ
jgi:hypothetical protein